MPFARPTLTDLRAQVQQDIAADPDIGDALLRFANTRVLGRAQADLAHLHYGYLDWIARQAVPFTAIDEFLEGWAGLKGITRKPATAAAGTITFNGTPGIVLPSGTPVARGDGVEYATTAAGAVAGGGTVTVPARASVPAAASNCDLGTAMSLGTAIAGIQSNGAAAAAFTGGADVEIDDDLRSRMLERYQAPPQGGAIADYVEWALQVAGVTRAWCKPNGMGAGTALVYFMMDLTEGAHNGFPQGTNGVAALETRDAPATGDQLAVANWIYPLRPVTALVYAAAPIASPVAFTIKNVAVPLQAAVAAAIGDVFVRTGSPGGVTLLDGTAGGTVKLADVWGAIAAVPAVGDFIIQSPTADITMSAANLPTVGTITWV